ncbi:multiprotein-bridging factor 1 family protein [Hyphomicrobium sp. LHD-15]|uniref:helix-turn-helix domain-containing protein n=1 Tax=Hyphomicrobium sp. LHD-15 TaxID=3072142 RepID=UPI0035BE6B02
MITAGQCRAARGLLGWTQEQLAGAAGIGLSSILYLEREKRTVSDEINVSIQKALERAGVEFIPENGGGAGVRLKRRKT